MYSIYVDGELIYAPNMVRSGYQAIAPKLKQQLDKADVLTFQLPPGCVGYDRILKQKSTVTVFDDDVPIFHGRCLDSERSFQNIKTIKCEGARAWLRSSVIRPYTFDDDTSEGGKNFWEMLLANHNAQVSTSREIGSGWVGLAVSCHQSSEDYTTTLEAMESFVKDLNQGTFVMRYKADAYRNVTASAYLQSVWAVSGQVIRFGTNLLDLNEYLDTRDVYTVILPVGKDGLTIADINGGKDYLESPAGIIAWGRIWKTVQFRDLEDPAELKAAGETALADAIEAALTLKLRAFDLKRIGLSAGGLELGEYHQVVSKPHGLDTSFQLSRRELDMTYPERSIYEFGVTRKTLTAMIV